jgi:hypothetical protein
VVRIRETVARVASWSRDWRVRVLVPVVLINLAAFGGLYWLMYRYAMANLVNTHRYGATTLLDQLQLDLHELEMAHNRGLLQTRLMQQASAKKLLAISVYDGAGVPIASTRGTPLPTEIAQVRVVMTQPDHPSIWTTEGKSATNLFGVRTLRNDSRCNSCHTGPAQSLGFTCSTSPTSTCSCCGAFQTSFCQAQ